MRRKHIKVITGLKLGGYSSFACSSGWLKSSPSSSSTSRFLDSDQTILLSFIFTAVAGEPERRAVVPASAASSARAVIALNLRPRWCTISETASGTREQPDSTGWRRRLDQKQLVQQLLRHGGQPVAHGAKLLPLVKNAGL